ncbi:hypothetical protein SD70_17155 [Gordoniibacillus kamchatkensis]|uniref:Photosynthesis system II assembly factor Ycf48/Hcf136-like domain-containing protein n=1 Tax=Gordoniibacillus kamchatkensis TaxID=1590651 RepID=A0ABR5AH89_9BACL|nr:YCF48-related protein [Paenibacillus sp. VKM B-2647]KIL39940.1 hypothetical protein SD70_17155 [Paenibacillus sp. VKM B-2647]
MRRVWIVWAAFVLCWGALVAAIGLSGGGAAKYDAALSRGKEAAASSAPQSGQEQGFESSPPAAPQAQPPSSKIAPANAPYVPVSSGGTIEVRGSDPGFTLSHLTVASERTAWVVRTDQAGADSVAATDDGGATWSVRSGMGKLHVLALHAVNAQAGWAAASSGCKEQNGVSRCSELQVLRTEDGGKSWAVQLSQTSDAQDAAIEAADDRHVVVLAGGKLLRTADGGRNWQELKPGFGGVAPQSISFPASEQGWVSGSICDRKQTDGSAVCRITVIATTDGGAHWRQLPPAGETLSGAISSLVRFVDAKRGWLLVSDIDTRRATLYGTEDGGRHWTPLQELSSARPAPAGLEFVSADDGWIPLNMGAGPIDGGMMVTHDGGRHFETIGEGRGWSFGPASALSGKEIWAVEHGRALVRTKDGGKTWQQLYPLLAPVGDIAFVDAQHGFGLGTPFESDALLATSDGGKSWRKLPAIDPQGAIVGISFASRQTGWALRQTADSGVFQLLRTTDGGNSWKALANLAAAGVSNRPYIRFFSAQDGVIAVTNGSKTQTVYRTKDGGKTWTASPSPYVQAGGGDLFAFSSPSTGWTYRDETPQQGAVLYRTEDGAAWQPYGVLPKPGWAYALGWASELRGWALYERDPFQPGSRWSLLATSDGGATWRETLFPAQFRIDDRTVKLQFAGDRNGWLLTGSGLLRTEDGGATWSWLGQ